MPKSIAKSRLVLYIAEIVTMLICILLFYAKLYVALSYGIWLILFIGVLIIIEKRQMTAEEMVIIASLSAIAAVGRTIFAPIPSVQPVSFIIICAASVFGWRTGLLVGMLSAFVSNLFLGQGPWTIWQMLCWGLMGLVAGYIFNTHKVKSKNVKMVFGFFAGILFGWIMNIWYLASYVENVSLAGIAVAYAASAYMDLLHGLSNVFFIAVFLSSLEKILYRIKNKYGILNDANSLNT